MQFSQMKYQQQKLKFNIYLCSKLKKKNKKKRRRRRRKLAKKEQST